MKGRFTVPVRIFQPDSDEESHDDKIYNCRYDDDDPVFVVVRATRSFLLQEAGYTTSRLDAQQVYDEFKRFFRDACSEVIVVFKNNTKKNIWPGNIRTLFEVIGNGETVSHLIVKIESLT